LKEAPLFQKPTDDRLYFTQNIHHSGESALSMFADRGRYRDKQHLADDQVPEGEEAGRQLCGLQPPEHKNERLVFRFQNPYAHCNKPKGRKLLYPLEMWISLFLVFFSPLPSQAELQGSEV